MSPESLLIHINGRAVLAEKGLTILQAARQNEIEIPTLCDFPGLPPHGSCRMCIVEIEGRANMPTACTTPAEAGMVIHTHSPRVQALRKEILQMLLADHPAGCLFCPEKDHCDECMVTLRKAGVTTGCGSCPKDNQCELQALAVQYDVTQPLYPVRYRGLPVQKRDPFFEHNPNLCILCGRCVRVCDDLHFTSALTYTSRGAQAQISTPFHRTHLATACAFCGTCVEVCPTGALSEKTRKWAGKPEAETTSTCALCALGCQVKLQTRGQRVLGSLPNRQAGAEVLCVKGRFAITELVQPALRLKQPQLSTPHGWQPATWEEAETALAEKLAACPPERFELRISAGSTLEDLFVARQFARDVLGSPARIAEAGQYGSALPVLARLLAHPATLEDLDNANTIACLGFTDRYAQTPVAVILKRAQQRGAQITLLGPADLSWAEHADQWLRYEPGEEAALLNSLPAGGGVTILLAPAALSDRTLLEAVEHWTLAHGTRAITLPAEANLAGALRLGLAGLTAPHDLDVLLLFGATAPEPAAGRPFIAAHSLLQPDGETAASLLLPATAFTEESGSLIDYAGRSRSVNPAVHAPGDARPAWQVLASLARRMGAPGFDYAGVEDIRQAALAEYPAFPILAMPDMLIDEVFDCPGSRLTQPAYRDIALAQRAAGLVSLYPRQSSERGQ